MWEECGVLCVMTPPGTIVMPLWSAGSWDSHPMVSTLSLSYHNYSGKFSRLENLVDFADRSCSVIILTAKF